MLEPVAQHAAAQVAKVDRLIFLGHNVDKARAIACAGRAGFQCRKRFAEAWLPHLLFCRDQTQGRR